MSTENKIQLRQVPSDEGGVVGCANSSRKAVEGPSCDLDNRTIRDWPISCFGICETPQLNDCRQPTPHSLSSDVLTGNCLAIMQTLWSRAGQAHRCGCRVCGTAISALGRRATTASRPPKVTFADIFTACYSSMFATAAVVDAVKKEDRKQELDRQLEETRRELAELQMLRTLETKRIKADNTAENEEVSLSQMDALWTALKDIYMDRPYMKEIHKPVTIRVSDFLNRLQADHYKCPDEATMRALRQTDYERLGQAVKDEEIDDSLPQRSAITQRQLHNDSRTVAQLATQLLHRAAAHDNSKSPSPSFYDALQMAYEGVSYTFNSIDPAGVRKNRIILNRRLREVVDSPGLNLKEKVGRVCYNMLVSAYPPDMHTYNTLIVAFDKHGYKYLSEAFVNSFFHYRRILPTPSTFVAILNHYKNSQNHGRFLRSLACITGLDTETGFKLRRRHVDDLTSTKAQTMKDRTSARAGDWIWERVPLDKPLIEAVIGGLLHFSMFDQAALFFVSCMKANVELGTNTIKHLFDECILALDWGAAVRLIQGFTNCPNTWQSMLMNRDEDTTYLISRLHVLLDLVGLRISGGQVPESTLDNLSISTQGFRRFLDALAKVDSTSQLQLQSSTTQLVHSPESRLLQIEALWKEQAFVANTTRSIESKLLYPDFRPQFRESMALHIGNTTAKQTLELNQELIGILSQMPISSHVLQALMMCEEFQSPPAEGEKPAKKEKRPNRKQLQKEAKTQLLRENLQERTAVILPEPIATSTGRTSRTAGQFRPVQMRARPRRLITWPVSDQRPAYLEQGQWAGLI
ncbi:hypothetical protein CEP54_004997 [Fusarium duplospermum]|uniref:Pentatricopeptide repeat domain-containing protein n=1 Tax=Fusarium duplospermum TaxID=1325734 RepID=A0A428QFA0_9HYPO|nr:hypothetical protein CEP54_004997 [Fusarium duplospermum]